MGRTYKYRIVLIGKDPSATGYGRFVVLTNDETITYEEVSYSFLSGSTVDHLDLKSIAIVEIG